MTIKVHSNLNLRMPENIAESLDIHAVFDSSCSKGMPQGMEVCMLNPRSIKQKIESVPHGMRFNTGSERHSENVPIIAVKRLMKLHLRKLQTSMFKQAKYSHCTATGYYLKIFEHIPNR